MPDLVITKEIILSVLAVFGAISLLLFWYGYHRGKKKVVKEENQGEAAVRRLLTSYCRKSTAHLLNNVTLEYKDGTTQVDHILLTQNGIIVIETKHYSGWIFANAKQERWTQVLFEVRHRFQNPIIQNAKHITAVSQLLDFMPKEQIKGLVVFTGSAQFKTEIPSNVIHIEQLVSYVDSIKFGSITENRLQFCVGRLEYKRLEITGKTDIEHQMYLEKKFGEVDEPIRK